MPTVYDPTQVSWQSATTAGAIVPRQDFEGDVSITSIQVPMIVLAASYAPLTINTTLTYSGTTFYHTKDDGFQADGSTVRFSREYARIPANREDWTEIALEFPGYQSVWGVQDFVSPRNGTTRAKITRRYYNEGVTVTSAANIPLSAAFEVVITPSGYPVNLLAPSGFGDATVPTAEVYRGYIASGTMLVSDDRIRRWKGNIYERETLEYIPR